MLGPALIIIVILAIPIGAIWSGMALAGVLGHFLQKDVDDEYEGTEYMKLG